MESELPGEDIETPQTKKKDDIWHLKGRLSEKKCCKSDLFYVAKLQLLFRQSVTNQLSVWHSGHR